MEDMDLLHQRVNQTLAAAGSRVVVEPGEWAEIDRLTEQIEKEDLCPHPHHELRYCAGAA